MKLCKKSFSEEPHLCKVKLNFSINPVEIPTLISAEKLKIIQAGDEKPYYVIQHIPDITEPANGVEFTREFWDSYLAKLKDSPYPGSKSGHTSPYQWYVTGDMDFYTIGGEIRGNSVYLKLYIPPEGYKSSNKTFIRNVKAGMVHFSIVSLSEDIIEINEDGEIVSTKAIKSVRGERNDATGRGMGAMEQKVNKKNPGDKPDNKTKTEVYVMADNTYKDIITNLNNQIMNGTVSKINIATDLKIEVATEEQKEAVKQLKQITEIIGENPVKKIKEMKTNENTVKQEKYDNMRDLLMRENFGPEKINENGQEKDNLKRQAAEPHVSKTIQDEKKLKEEIEKAKENPVVKNISFQIADVNSDINDLTQINIKKNKESTIRKSEYVEV